MKYSEKFSCYFKLFPFIVTIGLLCTYCMLFYPGDMLDTCKFVLDKYNTPGIVYVFWKMVAEVTRVLTLVASCVSTLAIVACIR